MSKGFFQIRTEIVEKLKEITEFKQIYTPLNSRQVTEGTQVTPSAHVNFVRIGSNDSAGQGRALMLGQLYAVTVACRNAQSQIDATAVTDEAGILLDQVIGLLSGWKPESSRNPLQLVEVKDGYSPAFCYLTAVFEAKRMM